MPQVTEWGSLGKVSVQEWPRSAAENAGNGRDTRAVLGDAALLLLLAQVNLCHSSCQAGAALGQLTRPQLRRASGWAVSDGMDAALEWSLCYPTPAMPLCVCSWLT